MNVLVEVFWTESVRQKEAVKKHTISQGVCQPINELLVERDCGNNPAQLVSPPPSSDLLTMPPVADGQNVLPKRRRPRLAVSASQPSLSGVGFESRQIPA